MSAHLIHVRSNETGRWVVQPEDDAAPLSEHESETAAEREAIARAASRDDTDVVVHDRYERVHVLRTDRPARRDAR